MEKAAKHKYKQVTVGNAMVIIYDFRKTINKPGLS
jgi:hypothetical protein